MEKEAGTTEQDEAAWKEVMAFFEKRFGKKPDLQSIIFLVGHRELCRLEAADLWPMFNRGSRVVIDVKNIFARKNLPAAGFLYWSL